MKFRLFAATVATTLLWAVPTFAATVSGKISDSSNTGLNGMEVRLWADSTKGYSIAFTQTSASDGTYSFSNVPAGTYKLDARMAPGVSGNYGDSWYDVDPPVSNGLVGEDADEIVLAANDTLTGMNIVLPTMGGLDGRVVSNSTPVQDVWVRVEAKSDPRIHHNDKTDGPCCGTNPYLGRFFMRGMAPTSMISTYRAIVYDPLGNYQTTVAAGPFSIMQSTNGNAGDISIASMPNDPVEPNNSSTDASTPTIANFPYSPTNAAVSPRGDIDYFCFNAMTGERFVAKVTSMINVEGQERRHPWFDPMIGLWDGSQIVRSNDDAIPGETLDAELDTGPLSASGRYCFVVTTFGDSNFSGAGQLSAGEYQIDIDLGNRPPEVTVSYDNAAAPIAPQEIVVDEGTPMQFVLDYTDPDNDVLNVSVEHLDSTGAIVRDGNLVAMANTGTYDWTPSQTAATTSPYEINLRVSDGEFAIVTPLLVRVNPVTVPPTVPVLVSPEDGAEVTTADVDLVLENSTDEDGDTLTYDFQVEFGDVDMTPEAEATEDEDSSGQTSTTVTAIPEDTLVSWRARAYDGTDYSAWAAWSTFFVSTANNPPDAPTIIKPSNGERLEERQPTIATAVPSDPEGDAVTLNVELSTSEDFAEVLLSSDPIEPTTDETMVNWLVPELLELGGSYYVRASATDENGATSEFSEVVRFSIAFDGQLQPPSFSGEFAMCEALTRESLPTEVRVLNIDNTGDSVTFEVTVANAENPDQALYSASAPQSDEVETVITIETGEPEPGQYVVRVRAKRGDETTGWTDCGFEIPGDGSTDGDGDGDANSGEEGCGCSATGTAPGSGLMLIIVGLLMRRRRRRDR